MTASELAQRLGVDEGRKLLRDGTFRTVAPHETLARLRPLLSAMGVTRVGTLTGLDRIGIPVVMACRPNARSLSVSQGKGLTLAAAQASGTMEAIELHHAETIDRPLKLASAEEMARAHGLIDLAAMPRVRPAPPDPTARVLWIEGLELFSGEPVWLPYELVHADYRVPLAPGYGCLVTTSNGLASGNHLLEAACHGLCEVVERDGTCLWNRLGAAGRARCRLDPDSVDDPACREVLDRLAATGFEIAVWDMTTDLGVPAFTCLLVDAERTGAHGGTGAGCHPRREVALLRALLEAVQIRTTYISGARDDLSHGEFTPGMIAERRNLARLAIGTEPPGRAFSETVAGWSAETFAEDLATLLERLRLVGIRQAALVDLSLPALAGEDWSLSVIRVVVPGLEGPDDEPGYHPGPRALGVGAADQRTMA